MIVLGVDPGLGRTGIGVVEGRIGDLTLITALCIETTPHAEEAGRLAVLMAELEVVLAQTRPDVAAVEDLFFASNRTTFTQVAQARGVILCALARAGVPSVSYTPNQVKEAVAGFGGAKKPQVARMTKRLLGVDTIPGHDDAIDACAVAITHHHRAGLGVAARAHGTAAPVETALDRAVAKARAAAVR